MLFSFTPQDNFNLRDDRGLGDNDQRHLLAVSGTLEAAFADDENIWKRILSGFQASYVFRYGSALPFNIVTGTDRNNDTNVNDRPVGVGQKHRARIRLCGARLAPQSTNPLEREIQVGCHRRSIQHIQPS